MIVVKRLALFIFGLFVCVLASQARGQSPVATPLTPPMQQELTPRELLSIMNERERAQDIRFAASEKTLIAALQALEKAVNKAEAATEKRFESVNEFRAQLKDQASLFSTKIELDIRFKATDDKLRSLEAKTNENDSRIVQILARNDSTTWLWGVGVAALGIVMGLIMTFSAVFKRTNQAQPRE